MKPSNTRSLWEKVFPEDSPAFLDYYYEMKTRGNEIGTQECDGNVVAMVHWNPYLLWCKGKVWDSRYLIAVATLPEYRHQGRMKELLHSGMKKLAASGMPFVWLMPADEKIYLPFDFRYVYSKWEGMLPEVPIKTKSDLCLMPVQEEEYSAVASFLQKELQKRYQVFALRTPGYLGMMKAEVVSEGGDILAIYQENQLVGFLSYWQGEMINIRELVCTEEITSKENQESLIAAIRRYFIGHSRDIKVITTGWLGEEKPIIMARILNLKEFVKPIGSTEPMQVVISVLDPVIEENQGIFLWKLTPEGSKLLPAAGEIPELTIGIADLVQWLLGNSVNKGWEMIQPFQGVFLNEIV